MYYSFQVSAQRMEVCVRGGRAAIPSQLYQHRGNSVTHQASSTVTAAAPAPIIAAAQSGPNVQQIPQLQTDFSHLLNQYGVAAAAAAVANSQNGNPSYIYQPLAAVLPYGSFFKLHVLVILNHLN